MNLVCSAHHLPVNANGKGCTACASVRAAWLKRRRERREFARAKAAEKAKR